MYDAHIGELYMKKSIIALFFVLMFAAQIHSLEMQLSFGPEYGIGTLKVDNDYKLNNGSGYESANQTSDAFFYGPGIGFMVRVFPDFTTAVTYGFVFRDNVIMATNYEQAGKAVRYNGGYTPIGMTEYQEGKFKNSESLDSDGFLLLVSNFNPALSTRMQLAKRVVLYSDLGINLTTMDFESNGSTLNYLGFGIFAQPALQINLTDKLYFEFGLNSVINIFSHQEGEYAYKDIAGNDIKSKYEDSGKFDGVYLGAYIHIGWRIDLKALRSKQFEAVSADTK
jgi:hypothetical protein